MIGNGQVRFGPGITGKGPARAPRQWSTGAASVAALLEAGPVRKPEGTPCGARCQPGLWIRDQEPTSH